jgi:hypothetical protein
MSVNRIREDRWQQIASQPTMVADSPTFVPCLGCFVAGMLTQQWAAYQQICRLAYERAVADSAPPWYQRLFANWN